MTETLCTSGAVKHRAGANASATIINSGAIMTEFINQAEGDIAAETLVNWVTSYSGMSADYKKVLEGACAAKAAIKVVSYDTANYVNTPEAAFIVNVLWGEYDRAIRVLNQAPVAKALGGTILT